MDSPRDDMAKVSAYHGRNDPVGLRPGEPVSVGEAAVSPEELARVAYEAVDLSTAIVR